MMNKKVIGGAVATTMPALIKKGYSNNSIETETSVAGIKGYYCYRFIPTDKNTGNRVLVVTDKRYTKNDDFYDYNSNIIDTTKIAVGDKISIGNGRRIYFECSTVVYASSSHIVVDTVPFEQFDNAVEDVETDRFIFIASKPDVGYSTIGDGAVTLGMGCKSIANGTFSCGITNTSAGPCAFTEGCSNFAELLAHAEGLKTVAAPYAHSEGLYTTASGMGSHVEGDSSTASGTYSHAEGQRSESFGNVSHAEGYETKAEGSASHTEGLITQAIGEGAHAEGKSTKANAKYSHAEGLSTQANGEQSHAEGKETIAKGNHSHAEGAFTQANGGDAHAEGAYSIANGENSHAEGYYTIASGRNSHVQGKCNIEDKLDKYAHIVGNGSSKDNRSNAHTLDWRGNAWFAGTMESKNIVLTSPSGTRYKITVSDSGALTTTKM